MDDAIIIAAITLTQGIAIAIISGMFNRDAKRRKEEQGKADQHAQMCVKESLLSMKLMSANISLTIAIASAIKEGKTNGKMATALAEVEKAQREYYDFIDHTAFHEISKEQ